MLSWEEQFRSFSQPSTSGIPSDCMWPMVLTIQFWMVDSLLC